LPGADPGQSPGLTVSEMSHSHADAPKMTAYVAEHGEDHGHKEPHAVSLKLLSAVLIALLFLTFLTVAVTWIDLGPANIWIALAIALVKAALVGAFFMHLYWDAPFNGFVLLASFAFVAVFIGLALIDTAEYKPLEDAPPAAVQPAQ